MATLARTSDLVHPSSGVTMSTPLLVPSFSSKGFRINTKGVSEVVDVLKIVEDTLTETVLVSAYDVYHGHVPPLDAFCRSAELTFIDSGGYETSDDHDLSAVYRYEHAVLDWDQTKLATILDSIPSWAPAVVVNYDHGSLRRPLVAQIDEATDFLGRYRQHLRDFIIKPETKDQQFIQVNSVTANAEKLRVFDIIGVAEKELGSSLLDRMTNLARIRLALDQVGARKPIHVFGSLDPVTSVLYFLAGAEIFDGLTWIRYSYADGRAIYYSNYGALVLGVNERDDHVKATALRNNLSSLRALQYEMKTFLLGHDFAKFQNHAPILSKAFDYLRGELKGAI